MRRHDGAGGSGEYHVENDHTARHNRNQIKPSKTSSPPQCGRDGVKKSILFFFTSFRRKPESSGFGALGTDWTPVFTGVTA